MSEGKEKLYSLHPIEFLLISFFFYFGRGGVDINYCNELIWFHLVHSLVTDKKKAVTLF